MFSRDHNPRSRQSQVNIEMTAMQHGIRKDDNFAKWLMQQAKEAGTLNPQLAKIIEQEQREMDILHGNDGQPEEGEEPDEEPSEEEDTGGTSQIRRAKTPHGVQLSVDETETEF